MRRTVSNNIVGFVVLVAFANTTEHSRKKKKNWKTNWKKKKKKEKETTTRKNKKTSGKKRRNIRIQYRKKSSIIEYTSINKIK